MNRKFFVFWQDWNGSSIEYLVLNETTEHICADSVIISKARENPFAARYAIICDPEWRVRNVSVQLVGKEPGIELSTDGNGNWSDGAGPVDKLRGAIDVDISATPFTNTIPIRRLNLNVGDSSDILTLYIRLPEMTVATDRQRYTCLESRKLYRFESPDAGFRRDIEVDGGGLVATYPGLFKRIE